MELFKKYIPTWRKCILFCLGLFGYSALFAQGSRDITPDSTGVANGANTFIGYLQTDDGGNSGNFLKSDATDDEKLYVYIRDGETLYYGIRRFNDGGAQTDVVVTIYDNANTIVQQTTLNRDTGSPNEATLLPQQGVIGSYARATAGPSAIVGTSGYNALVYTNNTGSDQDFWISLEETGAQTRSWYDIWDFSVYDGTTEKPGRLHARSWSFSSGSFAAQMSTDFQMYALVESPGLTGWYIKEVNFARIQPFGALFYANSTGADLGSVGDVNGDGNTDFLDARISQGTNIADPQYDLFVENPDIDIYPTSILPTVSISDMNVYCNTTGGIEGVVAFESNQAGIVTIVIDVNGEPGYQDGTTDRIIEAELASPGTQSVLWDGLDGLGATVPSGTDISVTGRFSAGPLHIPLWDVEINNVGISMRDVRPATTFDLIYWDDTNAALNGDLGSNPSIELEGTNSVQHTWTNGNNDLINTWSYGYLQLNSETFTLTYDCDSDGDGVSDANDTDKDNDGIPDSVEGNLEADADADGIPDYLDADFAGFVDANGDGVNDNFDADLDGVPDARDLDSDNDGIQDILEIGLADSNNDGRIDSFADLNGNGLNDANDAACDGTVNSGNATAVSAENSINGDGATAALGAPNNTYARIDNVADFLILDMGEVIPDFADITVEVRSDDVTNVMRVQESNADGSVTSNPQDFTFTATNTDENKVFNLANDTRYIRLTLNVDNGRIEVDALSFSYTVCNGTVGTAVTIPDTDQDGIGNHLDLDSDNDGLSDVIEVGLTASSTSAQINGFTDNDSNGWNDTQQTFPVTFIDTDGDGTLFDHLDLDSDNDGIPDVQEGQVFSAYIAPAAGDTDGDGLLDVYDPNNGGSFISGPDSDNDGTQDFQDTDSDNDGIGDLIEGHDSNTDGFGDWDAVGSNNNITDETGYNVDADSDGIWDIFDTNGGGAGAGIANISASSAPLQNTDGADNPDWRDTDDDNDGSLTEGEDDNQNGDWTDDKTQGQGGTANIPDYLFRGDYDGDGINDSSDLDSDNDGVLDTNEDGGEGIDPSGDADGDAVPNYRDPDFAGSLANSADANGDGVYDVLDKDLDGTPDYLDLDSDNDGILDAIEANGGTVRNGLNTSTGQYNLTDPDNDGLMNFVDNQPNTLGGTSLAANPDSDADGVSDVFDIDSDGDGIVDNIEAQSFTSYVAPSGLDDDGDGIDNAYDTDSGNSTIIPQDTDNADNPDYLDDDSDNDGVSDLVEGWDSNNNGYGDWDDDQNGATNEADFATDTDGDGLVDAFDNQADISQADNAIGSDASVQNSDGLDNPDYRDTDDDNDGELTADEDSNANGDWTDDRTQGQGGGSIIPDYLFNGDNDGDGVLDINDGDSDNDGIPDSAEAGTTGVNPSADDDGDGIPNWRDPDIAGFVDSNGDGVDDRGDQDLDGVPDFRDLDADNDGIPDAVEANNGVLPANMDADGFYPLAYVAANDTDGDGMVNDVDPDDGGTALTNPDTDGDGLSDFLDLDSDNDGLADILEAGGTDTNGDGKVDNFIDADYDGLADAIDGSQGGTAYVIADSDADGVVDYRDSDSDNDGISDTAESGLNDTDGDGIIDSFTDTDGDGLADTVDSDNGGTAVELLDPDGDGVANIRDLDSDNDGLQDVLEAGGIDANNDGINDSFIDADGDGLSDQLLFEPLAIIDTDGDGLANSADLDSDNDGIVDVIEFGQAAAADGTINGFTDANNNGWNDAQEAAVITPPDSDSDGVEDYLDIDADNDGIVDIREGQTTAAFAGLSGADSDGNGLDDQFDPGQGGTLIDPVDTDTDGTDDYLDTDSDNDNVPDRVEGHNADRTQYADWDTDQDGLFDETGFNTDNDGDGLLDIFDTFNGKGNANVTGTNAAVQNTDKDAFADFQDTDDDNDGTDTVNEDNNTNNDPTDDFTAGGTPVPDYLFRTNDTDGDGVVDSADADADNDGLANADEDGGTGIDPSADADGDGTLNYEDQDLAGFTDENGDFVDDRFDQDFDGVPDYLDLDSDNDGIADILEIGLTDANEDGRLNGITDANGNGMEDMYDEACQTVTSGNADAVTVNIGVGNATDALGNDNGTFADVRGGDELVLDLTDVIPSGTTIQIFISGRNTNPETGTIEQSNSDGSSPTNQVTVDLNFTAATSYDYTVTSDTRYLRFTNATDRFYIYSVSYSFCSATYGTAITPPDTDSDGVANYLDIDSDNDGITDNREAQATATYVAPAFGDADGDGLLDVYDEDVAAGNAIDPVDSEGTPDGTDDYLDSDSDDDGVSDLIEGNDGNSNGFGDWDTDGDNIITDEVQWASDSDGDGLYDIFDNVSISGNGLTNIDGSNASIQNTSGSVDADFRDTDDDGDGTLTSAEDTGDGAGGGPDGIWTNDFSQGGSPTPDYLHVPDLDGDGVNDDVDGDSDNDGISNADEYNGTDPFGDDDGDGTPNYLDPQYAGYVDANGDGVDDRVDKDGDGLANFFDVDSDNDGVYDAVEANNGVVPAGFNTDTGRFNAGDGDGDGVVTAVDSDDANAGVTTSTLANDDFDSDGLFDFLDIDSDDDGITDNVEAQATFVAPSGSDSDGDGLDDAYDFDSGNTFINPTNTDSGSGDTEPDYRDTDSDGDNILDQIEGFDANKNGFSDLDSDRDGFLSDETGFGTDSDGDGLKKLFDTYSGTGRINITGSNAKLQDTDNDGIADWRDQDDDGDGTLTTNEDSNFNGDYTDDKSQGGGATPDYLFFADSDGDGIPNGVDLDADNDGIKDVNEIASGLPSPFGDSEPDGIFNYQDSDNVGFVDTNGDSIDDRYDTDLDGIPNFFDLDSDNDGIPDAIEANNGSLPANMNDNGRYPIAYATANDADSDGLVDVVDDTGGSVTGGTPFDIPNSDGAGEPDFRDLDSDDDGIPDILEAGGIDSDKDGLVDTFSDTDGDGLANDVDSDNGGTAYTVPDSDADGLVDYRDLDSDNDGFADIVEAGGVDTNGDGRVENNTDTDGDGYADTFDTDNGGTVLAIADTDADGISNYRDLDSDNDGLPDAIEANGGAIPANMDATGQFTTFNDNDSDGFADDRDTDGGGSAYVPTNTDGDGRADYLDLDSDNDGVPDVIENGGTDADGNGRQDSFTDADGNGLHDSFDIGNGGTSPITNNDPDGDGLPNYRDADSDADGIPDIIEAGGTDSDANGLADNTTDTDGDGWPDLFDATNGGTALTAVDTDGDGLRNFVDIDADNDGVADAYEANAGVLPTGMNTQGTYPAAAADTDGDGLVDAREGNALPLTSSDADGLPDYIDTDADGDGVVDSEESFDDDNDGESYNDYMSRAAAYESANGSPGHYTPYVDGNGNDFADWLEDSDGDGVRNLFDPDSPFYRDSDNDGLIDLFDENANGQAYAEVNGQPDLNSNGTPNYRDSGQAVPLPVELLYFNASLASGKVVVRWGTASEINNDHFILKKSLDGENWDNVANIKGAGDSNEPIDYEWVDKDQTSGIRYYQLSQVDYDGSTEEFEIIDIEVPFTDLSITIYPNPATDYINIENNMNGTVRYRLVDMNGRLILNGEYQTNTRLNVSRLPAGLYLLYIESQGTNNIEKIRVNK